MEKMPLSVRPHGPLPYVYWIGGLLALLVIGTAVSYPIGLVLVLAGIVEWVRQFGRRHRIENTPGAASTQPSGPGGPKPGAHLMMVRWRSAFECGHPVIDMQHRELFNISNEVINSVLNRRPKVGTEYLLHELIEHIKDHFATEEDVLFRTHYPALEEHRNIHRQLLERAVELQNRYRQGLLPVSDLVGFVAYDVISTHVIEEDLKFALKDVSRLPGPVPADAIDSRLA